MTLQEIQKMYSDKFSEIWNKEELTEEQKKKMFDAFHKNEARELILGNK